MRQKIALVTGASRGIGRSIAVRLAERGMKVALNYNSSKENAEEAVEQIQAAHGDAFMVQGDVGDAEQVEQVFRLIREQAGSVDVLVNNAGITRDIALVRMTEQHWSEVLNTNLNSAFHCIKAATFEMMKKQSGTIINISSLSSCYGTPGQANYASSKAGLIGLTRCLAAELGPLNITANAVIPGLIPTAMTATIPARKVKDIASKIPLRRLGTCEEIAAVVDFLASEAAAYITGQVIIADGGLSCSLGV